MIKNSKVRYFDHQEIVVKNGADVNSLLIVLEGALVVQKYVDIEKSTTWPAKVHRNAINPDRKFEWRQRQEIKVHMIQILRVTPGQMFGYDHIKIKKDAQLVKKNKTIQPSCVCEGDLIADEANTKVLFVSSKILDSYLTKQEFDSLALSELITRRMDDLQVQLDKEAQTQFESIRQTILQNAVGFNHEPIDKRTSEIPKNMSSWAKHMALLNKNKRNHSATVKIGKQVDKVQSSRSQVRSLHLNQYVKLEKPKG